MLTSIGYPVCLLVGVVVGSWLNHRADRRLSPIPDVAAPFRAVIEMCRRTRKPRGPAIKMPRMRS